MARKKNGTFMLWIDFELAWGLVHVEKIDSQKIARISLKVREILDDVIEMLEGHQIAVTWAVLGHLLLNGCRRSSVNGLPHSDMPRPSYSWSNDDWYRYDPCTDVQRDPAWYGKDVADRLVNYVRSSKVPHEIGCHSFSHQMFGDSGCSEELARAEIEKCLELMKKEYGLVPKVFSFPRDYVGHVDLLKEYGFIGFRDTPPKLYPCLELERTFSNLAKTYFSLFIQFLSYYFLLPPNVVTPRETLPDLWAVPGCLPYSEKPLIPLRLVTLKAVKGINKCIQEGKIFSMYTHMRNLAESSYLLSNLEDILSYVGKKREQGLLEVKTMTELVREL